MVTQSRMLYLRYSRGAKIYPNDVAVFLGHSFFALFSRFGTVCNVSYCDSNDLDSRGSEGSTATHVAEHCKVIV